MAGTYPLILLLLVGVAALIQGDFVFRVIYLFAGGLLVGRWWSGRVLRKASFTRVFASRAFLGDDVPVRLEIRNPSLLPAVWLHVYDSIPPELAIPNLVNKVITLGPRGNTTLEYVLHARKRGYYQVGPLFVSSGDILGLASEERRKDLAEHLTVYPHIVPFTRMKLPSSSPLGTLRHNQPVFEDPTRVLNKRDYVAGDSLRRVDWKATAVTGRLQVKQFEASIALETAIFLNLNAPEYPVHVCIDATELAIVIAASVANWITGQKQTVGMVTNGVDPLDPDHPIQPIPPRKGRGHLMRILDILARVQFGDTIPIADVLRATCPHLSWGTTVILITGSADDALFDELFQVRRRGLNVVMILAGRISGGQAIQKRAERFGMQVYLFQTESDLDVWRQ